MKSTENKIENLEDYFKNRYYQEGCGAIELVYTDEEILWKQSVFEMNIQALCEISEPKSVLELGCGEGFMVDALHKKGFSVHGVDLSLFGLESQNPHLMIFCVAGNMVDFVNDNNLMQYDTICIMQSIQYLQDPTSFLKTILSKTSDDITLMISIPNNDSTFTNYAKEKKQLPSDFAPKTDYAIGLTLEKSLKMLQSVGLKVVSRLGIWPIEFNFLNENTNHAVDSSKGKNNHKARVLTHNFLYQQNKDEYLKILKAFGEIGIGRAITLICKKN